jgi:hypothetical protein
MEAKRSSGTMKDSTTSGTPPARSRLAGFECDRNNIHTSCSSSVMSQRMRAANGDDEEHELLPKSAGPSRSALNGTKRLSLLFMLCLLGVNVALLSIDFFSFHSRRMITKKPREQFHQTFLGNLFPVAEPNRTDDWAVLNNKALSALVECTYHDSCRENQTSIVVLSWRHFSYSIKKSIFTGEQIWCVSSSLM